MQNIKKITQFYIAHIIYWLCAGIWARSLFILFYSKEFSQSSVSGIFNGYLHGFKLDLSVASYIVSLSFIFWMIFYLSGKKIFLISYRIIHSGVVICYVLIAIADIGVYRHWNTKLNLTALQFASHPREVWASIGTGDQPASWVLAFLVSIGLFGLIFYRLQAYFDKPVADGLKGILWSVLFFVLLSGVSLLGIRGGFQLEPVNQSSAYYSDRYIENQAAINASWNLIEKLTSTVTGLNPYHFDSDTEVNQRLRLFYQGDTLSTSLASIPKPNIVFIILEGFTADVIPAFGGESGLTPTIDSLVKTGLIWTNFYANGDRTFKGLPAILNGFPTRPVGSVIMDPDQTIQLPSLAKVLKPYGYSSSFFYGGESEFANIKSFLINTGFEKIIDIKDFPASYRGKKWGVPDHYVLERLNKELNTTPSPFLACLLTLSTHEPYDIPIAPLIKSTTWPDLFRNTVYYADQSLGKFIHNAKNQSWYDSTLFILTADHGNGMPKDYPTNFEPGRFKIPLLIFGPALLKQYAGKIISKIGSQNDLVYSLLRALSVPDSNFHYSMNLMNTSAKGNAFYTFDHGFGIIRDDTKLAFDLNGNRIVYSEGPVNDSLIRWGKLLLQGTYGASGTGDCSSCPGNSQRSNKK